MAIRRIIILDRDDDPAQPGRVRFRMVLRVDVPASLRERFAGQRERLLPDTTAEEDAALAAGAIAEGFELHSAPAGVTWDQIRDLVAVRDALLAALVTRLGQAQAEMNARVPHALFHRAWDGTAWSP